MEQLEHLVSLPRTRAAGRLAAHQVCTGAVACEHRVELSALRLTARLIERVIELRCGRLELVYQFDHDVLRVELHDSGTAIRQLRDPTTAPDLELLLAKTASSWGLDTRSRSGGYRFWFRIDPRLGPLPSAFCDFEPSSRGAARRSADDRRHRGPISLSAPRGVLAWGRRATGRRVAL